MCNFTGKPTPDLCISPHLQVSVYTLASWEEIQPWKWVSTWEVFSGAPHRGQMLLVTFSILPGFCKILLVLSGSFSDKWLILIWIEGSWPSFCAAPEKVPKNLIAALYIACLYLVCAIPQALIEPVNFAFCSRDADCFLNQGHVSMRSHLLDFYFISFFLNLPVLCLTKQQGHQFMHCKKYRRKL